MKKNERLNKYLPLSFIPLFGGGLALLAALDLQLLGVISLDRHAIICYVIAEPIFIILSFAFAIIIMSRLANKNNTNQQKEIAL